MLWRIPGFGKRKTSPRLIIIGLDGAPFSYLQQQIKAGALPALGGIARAGSFFPLTSVHPCVSSVAWASCLTGCNPGKHNLFGFIERRPQKLELYFPLSDDCRAENLWSLLEPLGKRSLVINVPHTYPPAAVKGVMISGFLCTDLTRGVFPPAWVNRLQEMNYVIDVDAGMAQTSKTAFLAALEQAVDARFQAAIRLMQEEAWDYLQLHIMETDRLYHFLMAETLTGMGDLAARAQALFTRIDEWIERLSRLLQPADMVFLLSDHGFCLLDYEVNLNAWLQEKGYLILEPVSGGGLAAMNARSLAYSLPPGRIYLNLQGRERDGGVSPGAQANELLERLRSELLQLTDPLGTPVLEDVKFADELYHGPCRKNAPDAVAIARRGFDLKAAFNPKPLFYKGIITGMHTYDDAFMISNLHLRPHAAASILDLVPTLQSLIRFTPPAPLDGRAWAVSSS